MIPCQHSAIIDQAQPRIGYKCDACRRPFVRRPFGAKGVTDKPFAALRILLDPATFSEWQTKGFRFTVHGQQ